VCLLMTIVVVFRLSADLEGPGDLGTSSSVGLDGFTSSSAARTTSKTCKYRSHHYHVIAISRFPRVTNRNDLNKESHSCEMLVTPLWTWN